MNQQEHKIKRFCMAVLAHVDAGKTTLSEGLLYTGGSIRKVGRVDNKDAYFDNFELERTRGITIFSKQAQIYWKDCEITLLDTPGHVDFSAEMERTLQVLDYAILVVSGADGIQGHTRTLWRLLNRYKIPVFYLSTKWTSRERTNRWFYHSYSGSLVFRVWIFQKKTTIRKNSLKMWRFVMNQY